MNPINERIRKIILFNEGDVAKFAASQGMSRQSIHGSLNTIKPNYKLLALVMAKYPNTNAEWIKTGKGCPFLECNKHIDQIEVIKQMQKTQESLIKSLHEQSEMIASLTAIINDLRKDAPGK